MQGMASFTRDMRSVGVKTRPKASDRTEERSEFIKLMARQHLLSALSIDLKLAHALVADG